MISPGRMAEPLAIRSFGTFPGRKPGKRHLLADFGQPAQTRSFDGGGGHHKC